MRKLPNSIFAASLIFILVSFASGKVFGPKEYRVWYAENISRFKRTTLQRSISADLLFTPQNLIFIQKAYGKSWSGEEVTDFKKQFEDSYDFMLRLTSDDQRELMNSGSSEMTAEERIKYFAFYFQHDISMVLDGEDTLKVTEYTFEPSLSTGSAISVSFGFKTENNFQTAEIVVKNKALDLQNMVFSYSSNDLKKLPKLKKYNQWN